MRRARPAPHRGTSAFFVETFEMPGETGPTTATESQYYHLPVGQKRSTRRGEPDGCFLDQGRLVALVRDVRFDVLEEAFPLALLLRLDGPALGARERTLQRDAQHVADRLRRVDLEALAHLARQVPDH